LNSRSWSSIQWNVAVDRIGLDGLRDRQGFQEVADVVLDAIAAEALACPFDHGRRPIESDQVAAGKPIPEDLGHLSGPAPRVEHTLVANELQPRNDRLAPSGHRDRESVVRRSVPVARHGKHGTPCKSRRIAGTCQ
jgi:hypothetical protein